jgi:hypothetical protein
MKLCLTHPIEQLSFYGFPQNLQANAGIISKDGLLMFSITPLRIVTHNHLTFLAVDKASLNKTRKVLMAVQDHVFNKYVASFR